MKVINSNFDTLFYSSKSNITIKHIFINNSYFSSTLFLGISSIFTITGITINYPAKE